MTKTFYSNGKLLLTGEYAVLDGALSLAVPTKYGQSIEISEISEKKITWKSFDYKTEIWFETHFETKTLKIGFTTDEKIAQVLQKILLEAQNLNPNFLSENIGYIINTYLNFPKNWGLGTSSTLINNIAQWANIDPFSLLWNAFTGSGYDIACAMNHQPITYQLQTKKPIIKTVEFKPKFLDSIYFIYLNKKQNSREGITAYREATFDIPTFISKITLLTKKMLICEDISEFKKIIFEHENLVGTILNTLPVQQQSFQDFNGAIKSLGAWGGDFMMAVGEKNTVTYFKDKGYTTIIPYNEMVL